MTTVSLNKKFKMDVVVDNSLQDRGDDLAIQKKAEKAVAFLKKHGVPRSIARKK